MDNILNTLQKFDVYEYKADGFGSCLFSEGVTRVFGENKVIIADGFKIFASVQPLHKKDGLKLIGYIYKSEE